VDFTDFSIASLGRTYRYHGPASPGGPPLWWFGGGADLTPAYLFPEDAESSPNKMQQIFDRIEHFCLVGHTHVPGVFTGDGDFYLPTEMGDATWQFKAGEKVIVNPGSVGQPRDLDPRASYAIIDADIGTDAAGKATLTPKTVQFFRIEYPIEPVRAKIARVADDILQGNARYMELQQKHDVLQWYWCDAPGCAGS
jgi:diadenosine tetraphosphatase ApaH/serine/threonine PP2A family protein phosphatase